ncbi:NifB/NifX family molybdenum-iron cluster-binding protein [Shewanella youngdeokensis]|uniref:NifB/NifX family molybdenum-iron cluster-binding protein n=1 Tax=Shewanella youngdeokensis TaxID=2999068 RepID=A0ABZ0JWV7_9GAMM|nr:NifB/NifX family molybdenum-iron cluster-binding protein [Shewanella sp. DAU334]
MIIAMPMSRGRLASHFTKAQRIGFFNEYHQLVTSFDNPAVAGGCRAKKAMLDLLKQQKTDIVIVQHIGQRMLGKLLSAGMSVSQGDSKFDTEQLLNNSRDLSLRLLDASAGRESLNHLKKGGCCGGKSGGCGCSGQATAVKPLLASPQRVSNTVSDLQATKVKFAGFRAVT